MAAACAKDEKRGVPQGAPISPLLSSLYMRRFLLGWKRLGHARRLDAHIVNYAEDYVICCRGTAVEAMSVMRGMLGKLKLTVNEDKTRMRRLLGEDFDFLGYTIGRCHSPTTGQPGYAVFGRVIKGMGVVAELVCLARLRAQALSTRCLCLKS